MPDVFQSLVESFLGAPKDVAVEGAMTRIPKAMLPRGAARDALLARVHDSLTYTKRDGFFAGSEATEIELFNFFEDDKYLYVPREWYRKNRMEFLRAGDLVLADTERGSAFRAEGSKVAWRFTSTLDPSRNQHEAVAALLGTTGGILWAAPAKGKTVVALAALAKLHTTALIVVSSTTILEQWVERIVQHTSLKREDIGVVQGPRCDIGKPLLVGMVHSLSQRDYPPELYSWPGVLVVDEVHRMAAPQWVQTIPLFSAAVRWGLSATPKRKDRLHGLFMDHIGPIVYEDQALVVDSKVYVLYTRNVVMIQSPAYTNRWNGKINWSRLHTVLSRHAGRNDLLAYHMHKAWEAGRHILALSARKEHLSQMFGLLVQRGVPAEQLTVITGAVDQKKRIPMAQAARIVLAIERIAGEALDVPSLDTLFWLTPSQAVEQNVGRISRPYPGKKGALVFDVFDNLPIVSDLAKSREKKYEKLGFEFRRIEAEDHS